MLECRFQNVSQVIINQENEISKLNAYCRTLQRDLDKSFAAQKILLQQQQELQEEGIELKEFMQAEKNALSEALRDAENEVKRYKLILIQKDKEVENKQEECKHLVRISEQRRWGYTYINLNWSNLNLFLEIDTMLLRYKRD